MKTDEQFLLEEGFGGEKSAAFFAACKRLALGEPLAYLIGHTPFLNCTIHLDGRPLIPRVETEFWVEQAINTIKESLENQPGLFEAKQRLAADETKAWASALERSWQQPDAALPNHVSVLDLCAGSGCIGVAVAKAIPGAQVDFAEIDARLLPTIKKNIAENSTDPDRCHTHHSNLFTGLPPSARYDFILSNPPYIDPAVDRAEDSVKHHEPHLALYGGPGGMQVIAQLLADAAQHLAPNGQLWIEHEPEQIGALATLAREHEFSITHHRDQYDMLRYSILTRHK